MDLNCRMCKDGSDINTIAKYGKATLMINVAYTKAVDHRKLHSGPRRIHINLRNWNTLYFPAHKMHRDFFIRNFRKK
jgi:hypothetical protein